jgi:hypothetical protein
MKQESFLVNANNVKQAKKLFNIKYGDRYVIDKVEHFHGVFYYVWYHKRVKYWKSKRGI